MRRRFLLLLVMGACWINGFAQIYPYEPMCFHGRNIVYFITIDTLNGKPYLDCLSGYPDFVCNEVVLGLVNGKIMVFTKPIKIQNMYRFAFTEDQIYELRRVSINHITVSTLKSLYPCEIKTTTYLKEIVEHYFPKQSNLPRGLALLSRTGK